MRLQKTAIFLALLTLTPDLSFAKEWYIHSPKGLIIIPESSQPPADANNAKTDLIITKPTAKLKSGLPYGESPASLSCVYGLTTQISGCNINTASEVPTEGWGAIALVDAFYNPYARDDLKTYIKQFHLRDADFHQVYAAACSETSTPPQQGWWDEQVLDIELAHAMAPKAKIYLVEATSFGLSDMQTAIACATSLVSSAGGGVVSMSWSYAEFSSELSFDSSFNPSTSKVIYISSAGDYSAPARYPSASPYVISAGGTSIQRDSSGNFLSETAWSTDPTTPPGGKSGGSGGPSLYESRPSFQNVVQRIVGSQRGTPDISFNANPSTGNLVYSTYSGGWVVIGGTSSSAPALAGILNAANRRADSTQDELNYIYRLYSKEYHKNWHDILSGNNGYPALAGYDFATGLGSPLGYHGK